MAARRHTVKVMLTWIVGALAVTIMLVYVSTALDKLAAIFEAHGRLKEAEWLLRGALAIDESTLGADHPDIAKSLSNLAGVSQDQHRLEEAEPLYRRALEIDKKIRPEGNFETSVTLMDLAHLHVAQREFAKAEPLYKQALAIREKALPDDHPDIGENPDGSRGRYVSRSKTISGRGGGAKARCDHL